jgi:hypothetical protein
LSTPSATVRSRGCRADETSQRSRDIDRIVKGGDLAIDPPFTNLLTSGVRSDEAKAVR